MSNKGGGGGHLEEQQPYHVQYLLKIIQIFFLLYRIESLVDRKRMVNIIEHGLPTKNHVAHIYRKLMQDESNDSFYTKNKLGIRVKYYNRG